MQRLHRSLVGSLFLTGAAFTVWTALDLRIAIASEPFALYSVPTAVEMFPDEATANRVTIHGALLFLSQTDGAGVVAAYTEPKCGKMHFQCRAGEETMCRMQWQDVRAAIGKGYCAGFGTKNMLSTARLLAEDDDTLTKPDLWEMGMGVAVASYLGGQCTKARMLSCPVPAMGGAGGHSPGSGGAPGGQSGAGGSGGREVRTDAGGSPALMGSGGAAGSAGDGGTMGPAGGVGGAEDVARQVGKKPGSGCAIIGTSQTTTELVSAALVATIVIAATARRRRRNW